MHPDLQRTKSIRTRADECTEMPMKSDTISSTWSGESADEEAHQPYDCGEHPVRSGLMKGYAPAGVVNEEASMFESDVV